LIYTLGKPDIQPLSVAIQQFTSRFGQEPQLIQTTALLGLALPLVLFFMAQRFFMRGVVITGVDK
jgi:multiple sugar transport system permease protein